MLPTVDFCGMQVTRMILGANPFGGYSHQGKERDREMLAFHTVGVIKETWARAEAAGINTIITNNESPHVIQAVKEYLGEGGKMQWIAQVNCRAIPEMSESVDKVVEIGCKAVYFHGARTDSAYVKRNEEMLRSWCEYVRKQGIPVGVAGHAPETHYWIDGLDMVDFHAVPFFDCGSVHEGKGDKFQIKDMARAVEFIQKTKKPCIGYKIMGAGRIDAGMAFQYAYESIKPGDVVNIGVYRGDKDDMVEENVGLVSELLGG